MFDVDDLPMAFVDMVQKVTVHLRQRAVEPERVEVLFGKGAMAEVPADLLRRLFAVDRMWDVAIEFPERPGVHPGLIEFVATAGDWHNRLLLSPEVLASSR